MPAAAVIPAPVAYIKVVAVKKLVVEFRDRVQEPLLVASCVPVLTFWGASVPFTGCAGEPGLLP